MYNNITPKSCSYCSNLKPNFCWPGGLCVSSSCSDPLVLTTNPVFINTCWPVEKTNDCSTSPVGLIKHICLSVPLQEPVQEVSNKERQRGWKQVGPVWSDWSHLRWHTGVPHQVHLIRVTHRIALFKPQPHGEIKKAIIMCPDFIHNRLKCLCVKLISFLFRRNNSIFRLLVWGHADMKSKQRPVTLCWWS